jgi:hypothetical protein
MHYFYVPSVSFFTKYCLVTIPIGVEIFFIQNEI